MRPGQDIGVINGGGGLDPGACLPFIIKGTSYKVMIRKELLVDNFGFEYDGVFQSVQADLGFPPGTLAPEIMHVL